MGNRIKDVLFGALAIVIVVGVCIGLGVGASALGSFDSTNGGEVAVVRNGGPFDNHRIRQVLDPGSSITYVGIDSSTHKYPAQQRFYTITSVPGAGDRGGVDVVHVPSSDGVDMGIEGTLYFSLNTDHTILREFDDKFGTRKFRSVQDGKYYSAYSGNKGWLAFLDTIVRPVIDNDLREQVNGFTCTQLVSSCALVQLGTSQPKATKLTPQSNNTNISLVQDAINKSLANDLEQTLGAKFLVGLRFSLNKVTLPQGVQAAVTRAQAAFAQVTEAQARVQSARADAEANRERQSGYKDCPACADIDRLKAIPPGVHTYAPGAAVAVQ